LAGRLAPRSQGDLQRCRAAQAAADWIHAAHKAAIARWRLRHEAGSVLARLWPDGAQVACRPLSGIPPAEWLQAYTAMVAAIRTGHGPRDAILRPVHRWRGTAHRVLLRNPYADIGLTCLDGQAAVWIGERIDRDYRIRCEWSDVSGPARHWLASIAPTFAACAERLGFVPIDTPIDQPWLEAA
jgi:hypothetical protein